MLPRCCLVPAVARQLLSLHVKFPADMKLFTSGNVFDKFCRPSQKVNTVVCLRRKNLSRYRLPDCSLAAMQFVWLGRHTMIKSCCFRDAGLFQMTCSMSREKTPAPGGYANILCRCSREKIATMVLCVLSDVFTFQQNPSQPWYACTHHVSEGTGFLIDTSQTFCWLLVGMVTVDDIDSFEVNCFQDSAYFCQTHNSNCNSDAVF